jgi:2-oxoglutarate ferredoxin oxidoreductase subunit delta
MGVNSLFPEVKMPDSPPTGKVRKFRGEVYIHWDRCKGCGFCIEFCPPKVLAFSDKFNTHGYHPPYLAKEAGCTGCDLCGLYCPDFAIFGVRVPIETQVQGALPAAHSQVS